MSERLRLKEVLQSRKFRKMEISIDAEKEINSIKELLAPASFRTLAEIDCRLVFNCAERLKKLKNEYVKISEEIEKIEKELE